jgi:hypothetical protein
MINHGNIESLEVRDTEPIFDPMPLAMKDVKLDSDEGPRPEVDLLDFELCMEVRRLMRQLDALITGTIEQIVVRGGIARRIVLRATTTRAPSLCGPGIETDHQQTNTSDQPNGGSNHER